MWGLIRDARSLGPRSDKLDRERVEPRGEFGGERPVDPAVGVDPRQSAERRRANSDAEMRLSLRPRARMTGVQPGFIFNHEFVR